MKKIGKRRKREGKTNYAKRKRLLESGKPRIVARKTNRYVILQYIESRAAQDYVKASVNSKILLKYGWPVENSGSLKSIPAAYLTGLIFGMKIKDLKKGILDIGMITSTKGSRIYAAVKGMNDAGAKIPCDEKMLPTEVSTERTKTFFDKIKSNIMKGVK